MGLDMHLYAERYLPGYDYCSPEEKASAARVLDAVHMKDHLAEGSPNVTVEVCVAYWRKANAIHRWFVDNVQDGKDECQRSYVTREQLVLLRDTCARVLACSMVVAGVVCNGQVLSEGEWVDIEQDGGVVEDPAVAQEHLPTQAGFFFGSTNYDEWYVDDLKATVEQLTKALSLGEEWTFYYRSSW